MVTFFICIKMHFFALKSFYYHLRWLILQLLAFSCTNKHSTFDLTY